jgi:hypothetical protein
MIISSHQLEMWLPLIVVILPVIGAIVRYSVLLVGLIVTLSKSIKADRPYIFQEFARAMTIPRLRHDVSSACSSDGEACTYVRELPGVPRRGRASHS